MAAPTLLCPMCGGEHPASERFCPDCRVPLVLGEATPELSAAQQRARKIKKQYCEGEPVKVARVRNQVEADFVQALLLDAGVPSFVRRAPGYDVPDFLAAGPRDVLVPQSGEDVARDMLLDHEPTPTPTAAAAAAARAYPAPARVLAGLLLGLLFVGLVIWLAASAAH
jgi:hypothetical protein